MWALRGKWEEYGLGSLLVQRLGFESSLYNHQSRDHGLAPYVTKPQFPRLYRGNSSPDRYS